MNSAHSLFVLLDICKCITAKYIGTTIFSLRHDAREEDKLGLAAAVCSLTSMINDTSQCDNSGES